MSLHPLSRVLCVLAAFSMLALTPAAEADSRDDWLAALGKRAEALASLDPERVEAFRETAVILAEELNRFTIEETEIRTDDKVPPPDVAVRRPGEGRGETSGEAPGETASDADAAGAPVSLSNVPNTWFNYHITEANRLLARLIAKIGEARTGAVPPADLRADAVALDRALDRLNRPPEPR